MKKADKERRQLKYRCFLFFVIVYLKPTIIDKIKNKIDRLYGVVTTNEEKGIKRNKITGIRDTPIFVLCTNCPRVEYRKTGINEKIPGTRNLSTNDMLNPDSLEKITTKEYCPI